MTIKLGWFTSGNGEGSLGLFASTLFAIKSGLLDASIEFVFLSDGLRDGSIARDHLITLANMNGAAIAHSPGPPDNIDKVALNAAQDYGFDYGVMAGFMHFTPKLARVYPMINVHPDIPGRYGGTYHDVIKKVIDNGDTQGGITVHWASDVLDGGDPILTMSWGIINHTYESLRQQMLQYEGLVLVSALNKLALEGAYD